ncbi:hypothetical protein KIW84_031446 [Lathyrus oleraceus]|uniref:Retrovirus-related Pol polyprotein from transposon TNT 1-94-like beta-barrel domain-containing protein n=1 Tax=Pisum sativum TaxID=3888 RepID=A0A9D5B0L8_PEA|nr:hypothetical protein KIW84_031446 [Pisum sativum]
MTSQKVWLAYFDESKKIMVKLGDNSSLQAEGTGNIVIQRRNGAKAMIKDVHYVPGIKCNLLSVRQLTEKGSEHEENPVNDTPTNVEVKDDNRLEVKEYNQEGVARTSQRPKRPKVLLARLQDYDVVGDDEIITNG